MSLITELLVPALFSLNSYLKYNSDISNISINSILSWKYTIEMLLGKQNYKVQVYLFQSVSHGCGLTRLVMEQVRLGMTEILFESQFLQPLL